MTRHQTLPQFKIVSLDRTLADAAAMSILAPSPEHTAKLIAAIRQYAEDLRAARAAEYGDLLSPAEAPPPLSRWPR